EEEEEKNEEGGEEVLHLLPYTPFTHSFNRRQNSPAPDQKPRRRDLRRRKANQHSHLQIVPASENLPHRSRRGRLEEVDAFHRLQDSADLTRGNNAAVRVEDVGGDGEADGSAQDAELGDGAHGDGCGV
ncbi:MAG: hypothetical protein L6R35_007096, partial [Caloplaca aegaea]